MHNTDTPVTLENKLKKKLTHTHTQIQEKDEHIQGLHLSSKIVLEAFIIKGHRSNLMHPVKGNSTFYSVHTCVCHILRQARALEKELGGSNK